MSDDMKETRGSALDIGRQREVNQDYLATARFGHSTGTLDGPVSVYIVADGMGGHDAGEVASKLAVNSTLEYLHSNPIDALETSLHQAMLYANQIILHKQEQEHLELGTTLVVAAVKDQHIHVANVGDSRAYLSTRGQLLQITRDHSLVQALVDMGNVNPADAANHPRRNILTQALGRNVSIDIDHFTMQIEEECYLLLCSDGLWGLVGGDKIQHILWTSKSSQAAADQLVEMANAAAGDDNIATVIAHFYAAQ